MCFGVVGLGGGSRVDSVKGSLRVLEESSLVPFLQQLLENDSLLDVDRHASLYTSVFKVRKRVLLSTVVVDYCMSDEFLTK